MRGGGPQAVVTNLGLLQPDSTGELIVTALHPNVTFEQVQENTGWQVKQSSDFVVTEPPKEEELRILREELDPQEIYI